MPSDCTLRTMSRRQAIGALCGPLSAAVLGGSLMQRVLGQDNKDPFIDEGSSTTRKVKVAAIQLSYILGDFLANLNKVANMVREAGRHGARWIVLPEYFASGIAWHEIVFDAALPVDGLPSKLLKGWAKETGAAIGGTILAKRGQDTYNTLILAHPSGQTFFHDKDLPTGPLESAHWIAGSDDGVFNTPEGSIGAAICWEQIRFRTARRLLQGKVRLILAPSAFGALNDKGRAGQAALLENAPIDLARLVGAPVILANPVGAVEHHYVVDGKTHKVYPTFLGNSQIVDGYGNVVARRTEQEGEGILYGTIDIASVEPSAELQDRFWIPEMPTYWLNRHVNSESGVRLYEELIRPLRNGMP